MTSDRRCFCGEMLVAATYEGHRAITNLQTGNTEAPVTLTCLNNHVQEFWMGHQEAIIAVNSVKVVSS